MGMVVWLKQPISQITSMQLLFICTPMTYTPICTPMIYDL